MENTKYWNPKSSIGKRMRVKKISFLEDGKFVDYWGLFMDGRFFTLNGGEWKFKTKAEAEIARPEMKRQIKEAILTSRPPVG